MTPDTTLIDAGDIPFEFQVRLQMADWAGRDPTSYLGRDWWQLSPEEEAVFAIDRVRFPILACALHAYEAFKDIAMVDAFGPESVLADARRRFPAWAEPQRIGLEEFAAFAKRFCGLTPREAHAIYAKHEFCVVRAGVAWYRGEEA